VTALVERPAILVRLVKDDALPGRSFGKLRMTKWRGAVDESTTAGQNT
jgi:hypothetical protein